MSDTPETPTSGAGAGVGHSPGPSDGEDTAGGVDVGTPNLSTLTRPAGLDGEPLTLEQIERRIQERFADLACHLQHGELTVFCPPDRLLELLEYCRDDEQLRCDYLADLSGVHWPAGEHVIERQTSTTGWPEYRNTRERGVIEVLYILRSTYRNHWLRVSVGVDEDDPVIPSATVLWETANFHEREVYDFFGVNFEGHPNLLRILMPDGWVGHPLRKDYPLGGVDIPYKHDAFIPSPERRELREVVE